jgi:hypothetical protein
MPEDRATQASTSASLHLLFDKTRPPRLFLNHQPDDPDRLHLNIAVDATGWPTHDAHITLTAHRDDLLALLDQAHAEITAAEP